MARNRIRGITVEIGGDVTKLDKALESTNKNISTTSSKLKDVEKLLKFDPTNVELLDQKQRLLAQSVEATTDKYQALQQIAENSTVSNVKYAQWEEALKSLQSQIASAAKEVKELEDESKNLEQLGFAPDSSQLVDARDRAAAAREKLEELQASVKKTYDEMGRPISIDQWDDLQRELSETKKNVDEAKDAFDKFSPTVSKVGSVLKEESEGFKDIADNTKKLSLAAGGLLTGMLGSVKGTEEFRSDLSKVETNARLAGVGLDAASDAMKQLNSVSDETDSSVEALSNLLQAGVTESTLQQAVENLAGAAISFPDTIKIESLADSLQETLATGSATGQFAEVLDRLGVGADNFNEQLSQVPGTVNQLHLALDTLQNQGLAEVYNSWRDNNEALVENKDATYEFQKSLAELGNQMQPLMTTVTELASSFLDWFNGLSDGKQEAIVTLIALVAAISPLASGISSVARVVGDVSQNWGAVKKAASSVSSFIVSNPMLSAIIAIAGAVALIALNWDKVKETAKKAIDAIVGFIQKGINAVQEFFNSLNNGGKDGGGKSPFSLFSGGGNSAVPNSLLDTVSLDSYPHFASGGVFAPNNPMLGVLGDNRTEYEVAAPESVIRDSVLDALAMSGQGGAQSVKVNIMFAGDLAQLGRVLNPVITAEGARLGTNLAPR